MSRKTYEIDASMMGGEWTDEDDLQHFAEVLQEVVGDAALIVPITWAYNGASDQDSDRVSEAQWNEALDRYYS